MTNEPAFSVWELNGQGKPEMTYFGMSMRDYFAAKAMQGMLSDPDVNGSATNIAKASYEMADAMLKEREK